MHQGRPFSVVTILLIQAHPPRTYPISHAAPIVAFDRARSRRDGWFRLGLAPEGPRQRPEHRAGLSHRTSHQLQQAKRNISVPTTFDDIHCSILIRDVSDSTDVPPGDMVPFKWDLLESLEQADLCVSYYGAVTSIPVCTNFNMSLSNRHNGFVIRVADAIPWKDVTGYEGMNARVSAHVPPTSFLTRLDQLSACPPQSPLLRLLTEPLQK
ncbi:BQ5605_C004g03044 [Microbotryum silenes-dioicae]|uniref:BQ5605_C004g03044 protein n=1 Tax=Microbotryum silenes-dioicae TaxID=796604 RepID=A0A2X0N3L4_9BASI|nr:BQ5605_C004g03044 [Microbotryum silenes-dioicae]